MKFVKKTLILSVVLTAIFVFSGCTNATGEAMNASHRTAPSVKTATSAPVVVTSTDIAAANDLTQTQLSAMSTTTKTVSSVPAAQNVAMPAEEFLVTRVIDGDTIELENGQRVRYIGMDTPETVSPSKPVQCFGKEASDKNKELVLGKKVRLEKDITDRDKYDRLLRYVYVGDLFVNLELVRRGYAFSYTYPPDVKFQDEILSAQQQAREEKAGLWLSCPTEQGAHGITSADTTVSESVNTPVTTSANNTSAAVDPPGSCVIKGNISSGGKIYHLPGCGSYNNTIIVESDGERWFCTEEEAIAAGWRKALNCP